MTPPMPTLFDPITVGDLRLPNRILLAPLTRNRSSGPGRVPNSLMRDYYVQRASAGAIITEATSVTPTGVGYPHTPGVWSQEQVDGWRRITEAVHAASGRILMQLWHVGRISDPSYHDGALPVAPSAIAPQGRVSLLRPERPYAVPRALETEEVAGVVEAFREGARNAKTAGFDGVEIHGANGYLLDQFLQDGSNKRTDAYGGSVENRARLLLEVTEAVVSVWGAGRVGVRIAPSGTWASMSDSNPQVTFGYVAQQLNRFDLAYLHVVEPRIVGAEAPVEGQPPVAATQLRKIFKGTILAAGGFEPEGAADIVDKGDADLVAFGRHFAANPDLPKRIELGLPLNPYDRDTFWGGDHRGYSDYPF